MSQVELIHILKERFLKHMHRHQEVSWPQIETLIQRDQKVMHTILNMEQTGGQPDVMNLNGVLYMIDLSKESPMQRRSLCYDEKARLSRKKFPPESSVMKMAHDLGVKVLDEAMYIMIQEIESIDLKTSSWILTPQDIRNLGGALFANKHYERTFVYYNGADSYYGSRGFRGYIKL